MKQRLGIAQALLHDPELIILDEPTTGLDPQGIIDMRNLILRLKHEQKKTILLSSHLLSEIEIIADRMVIINNGKSIVEGDVRHLLNSEDLVVSLEVDDIHKAGSVVKQRFPQAAILGHENNQLRLSINRANVPLLNNAMVAEGIQVYAIESRRKLEDYFIKIVNP
jgi:ABC-type multidrug transport system ATPase subunit